MRCDVSGCKDLCSEICVSIALFKIWRIACNVTFFCLARHWRTASISMLDAQFTACRSCKVVFDYALRCYVTGNAWLHVCDVAGPGSFLRVIKQITISAVLRLKRTFEVKQRAEYFLQLPSLLWLVCYSEAGKSVFLFGFLSRCSLT